MKTLTLSVRNIKEILRDPLTIIFSLGFPVVLLFAAFCNTGQYPRQPV